MNSTLFRSRYLLIAIVLVAGFVAWMIVFGIQPGRGARGDVGYLLWSGWVALALYLAVLAYVARKYVHRVRKPPSAAELAPVVARMDRAALGLKQIEREMSAGALRAKKDIKKRVGELLRREGVTKLLVVDVVPGGEGEGSRLESRSPEPAARTSVWLHAHLYLGLAAAVLVLLHGGLVLTTPMGMLLNGLSLVVTLSGVVGVYFWAVGPARLTRAEQSLTIEEAYAFEQHFDRKLREALEEPRKDPAKEVDKTYDKAKLAWDELIKLRPAFSNWKLAPGASEARAVLESVQAEDAKLQERQRDLMVLFGQRARVRAELRRLSRTRFLMNFWRIVHVPTSVVLVGLVIVHILSIWWY